MYTQSAFSMTSSNFDMDTTDQGTPYCGHAVSTPLSLVIAA